MKIQVRNNIGGTEYLFEVEQQDDREALLLAAFLGTPHKRCGKCKSTNIKLSGNRAKGFTFVKIRCLDCNARCQMGEYREGGFFWKDWEEYAPAKKPVARPAPAEEEAPPVEVYEE